MFKLDKNTHMMVLFTFSLIFIVVYLYYTITDVRKMQKEVKRISDELAQLQSKGAPPPPQAVPVDVCLKAKTVPVNKANEVTVVDVSDQIAEPVKTEPVPQFQDNESVVTEEIRDTLDCTDDEDIDLQNIINSSITPQEVSQNDVSKEHVSQDDVPKEISLDQLDSNELSKMKYDDVKDLCKSKNLSTKGSKDVLIKRLLECK